MTSDDRGSVGMGTPAYYLPAKSITARDLAAAGLLEGVAERLESFGFTNARVATNETTLEMAVHAARAALEEADVEPERVGLVLYATALATSGLVCDTPAPDGSVLQVRTTRDLFRYPASALQDELNLTEAAVAGIDQQGCASVFAALRFGRAALLDDDDLEAVLCVSADRLPDGSPRDMLFNLISDAACAVVLRRQAPSNRIVASHHVTKGTMWDAAALEAEVIASYFPTAASVIEATLRKAQLTMDDIDWVIPHNVSLRSWEILLGMLRVPASKLFSANIARVGHTMAADNFINLRDASDAGILKKGDRLLLFTFGFGLHWSCMIVEH